MVRMTPEPPVPHHPLGLRPAAPPERQWLRGWRGLALLGGLALACAAVCLVGVLLAALSRVPAASVTVVLGDSAFQAETRAATVAGLLVELNLPVREGDALFPAPDTPVTPGMIVRLERSRPITLTVDGVTQTVNTLFNNPLDILKEAGIVVGADDRVLVDGTPASPLEMLVWPVPATRITVRRAMALTLIEDDQRRILRTTAETVGEALFEAGVTLYLADAITPGLNTPIVRDMVVTIRRSRPVTIVADGVTLETRAQGSLVADALASAGIALSGLDYTIPAERSPLRPGMVVRVIRVTEEVAAEQQPIPFQTLYQADPSLELDQRAVLQEGQNGILQTNVRIRYENGVEVRRTPESESVVRPPTDRVVAFGTGIVVRTVETPDGPREYWRRIRMYATSYHPAALDGDDVTATGRKLTKGIIASDPTILPYGTQVFVPGYGVGLIADTGGPRRRLWVDLGYDDANYVPWSRWVDVYVLTPVSETINYRLPE